MKTLPVSELELVGMIFVTHCGSETETDWEYFNKPLADKADFSETRKGFCDCCGQRVKYICEVVHRPTLKGFYVGRTCAVKVQSLGRFTGLMANASVALAERAVCNKRESEFLATVSPELVTAYQWAKVDGTRLAKEFVAKLRRWGSMSEGQKSCLIKMYEQSLVNARIAATGVKCPSGCIEITGTIISIKCQSLPYYDLSYKMTVRLNNEVRLHGTCPISLIDKVSDFNTLAGRSVRLVATIKPSDKNPLFGFFSRPTKAVLV